MRDAVTLVAKRLRGKELIFIALGEDGSDEVIDGATIHFVSFEKSAETVARYFQAADVYVHAAKADTFSAYGARGALLWYSSRSDCQ